MSTHRFTALTPVTATGQNHAEATEYARALLDDNNARLDETLPAGNLTTGPVTLLDRDEFANTLRAIRNDAESVRSGRALTRAVPSARIIKRVETLLAALGEPADGNATPADPGQAANLGAAILRARDLRDAADPDTRAQISTWIEQARAAQAAGDADEIRRLLAQPYVTTGGAR